MYLAFFDCEDNWDVVCGDFDFSAFFFLVKCMLYYQLFCFLQLYCDQESENEMKLPWCNVINYACLSYSVAEASVQA